MLRCRYQDRGYAYSYITNITGLDKGQAVAHVLEAKVRPPPLRISSPPPAGLLQYARPAPARPVEPVTSGLRWAMPRAMYRSYLRDVGSAGCCWAKGGPGAEAACWPALAPGSCARVCGGAGVQVGKVDIVYMDAEMQPVKGPHSVRPEIISRELHIRVRCRPAHP